MKPFEKYLLGLTLMLCLAGSGNAQVPRQNRRKQETENVADTMRPQTMTHTIPLEPLRKPEPPKNPKVKFCNLDEALYLELQTFTNMTHDNVKCVFSPLVVIKPFVRLYDKVDVGITTTQMVQNYTTPNMSTITHDMYVWAKLRTNVGEFSVNAGKKSELNYAGEFAKDMTISNFFVNGISLTSGNFHPCVVSVGFKNDDMAVKVGYAKTDTEGFKITGHGALVIVNEVFIDETFKGGISLTIGPEKTRMDLQGVWTPTLHSALLLEASNIGRDCITGLHGTYRYICDGGKVAFFVNGFKQLCEDGIAGGTVGVRFPKTGGIYCAVGVTVGDPLCKTNSDGTPNIDYENHVWVFCGEFGMKCALWSPKIVRSGK